MLKFFTSFFKLLNTLFEQWEAYKLKKKLREELEQEERTELDKIIEMADKIRTDDLPDDLLLSPEDRERLPNLPTDIPGKGGSNSSKSDESSNKDKSS